MKKKILIINKEAFGVITDAYKWCEYLKDDFDITFLCLDSSSGIRTTMEGITIKYAPFLSNKSLRGILFMLLCFWNILWFRGLIFLVYFEPCHVFKKLMPWKRIHLDVRTLSVTNNQQENLRYNTKLCNTCDLYNSVSVISEDVLNLMEFKNKNRYILPLGSDVISTESKDYSKFQLLYVGALDNRNISITVEGLHLFHVKYPSCNIQYGIIGTGSFELAKIKDLIGQYNLKDIVTCHGYVPYRDLRSYFDGSSYGVSFVPQTDYYDKQPVTKTFEYILSGLFTIATSTTGNVQVINEKNGLLINDSAQSFAEALEYIYFHHKEIDENSIRASLEDCTWKHIVNNQMKKMLLSI